MKTGIVIVLLPFLLWGCSGTGGGGGGPPDGPSDGPGTPPDGGVMECVTALAARGPHTCVLTDSGSVFCWGRNHRGELGDGTTTDRTVAVQVTLPGAATQVSAGVSHTCALVGGTAYCWGLNENGQLGDGTTQDRLTPVPVAGLSDVVTLRAGGFHTCAVTSSGALWCWGDDTHGQIGDGNSGPGAARSTPVQVRTGVTDLSLGEDHSCAVLTNSSVACWGRNDTGQLGDGGHADRATPGAAMKGGAPFTGVQTLHVGAYHTCAIRTDGSLFCWGSNDFGQLGLGSLGGNRAEPMRVGNITNATLAALGESHTCVVLGDGSLQCWGGNLSGQLGTGDDQTRTTPTTVSGLAGVTDVATGDIHTCALAAGTVYCWGDNEHGQLGTGDTDPQDSPVPVSSGCR